MLALVVSFRGELAIAHDFTFTRVVLEDLPTLYRWFAQDHVNKWWPIPQESEKFFDHFLKRIRSTEISPYMVSMDGAAIGYLQSYPVDRRKESWLPELPDVTIGIDQFIGEKDFIGKGYGTLMVKAFITKLKAENPDVTVMLDPDPKNLTAIRCYEKVGFVKLGEFMRDNGDPALIMVFR